MNTSPEIHIISLRSARIRTKYSNFFVAIALLAAFLQGCGQGKGGTAPPEKVKRHGLVCTVQRHLENVQINGNDMNVLDFKKAGCVLKFDAKWPTFYRSLKPRPPTKIGHVEDIINFPTNIWSRGDVLKWEAANASYLGMWKGLVRWIVQGRTDHTENGAVVVDCESKGLKIALDPVQTVVLDVFEDRLTSRGTTPPLDTCTEPLTASIDNVFQANIPCSVKRALERLKINGQFWEISKYEEEGCRLISDVPRSCWNADAKKITFDEVKDCWDTDEEHVPLDWADQDDGLGMFRPVNWAPQDYGTGKLHVVKPGDEGRKWVYLDCEDKGLKIRLASYSTDVFQKEGSTYKYKARAPSTCHEPWTLAIETTEGFQNSLIQQREAISTNLQGGPDSGRINGTRQVITPKGNALYADKTTSSSQRMHRVPWAKRSVDLVSLHEAVKLAPDDSSLLFVGAAQ